MDERRNRGGAMVKVTLYVEGGGDSKAQHSECREGFRKLLEKAGFRERMPKIVACGGRGSAFDDFKTALSQSTSEDFPILFVDSESPVQAATRWGHLRQTEGVHWQKPDAVTEDHLHLMVQCMETWIVADRNALKDYFGQHLRENALPPSSTSQERCRLEQRSKESVQDDLERATHDCGRDRQYRKGKKSFIILSKIDPHLLKDLPHFQKFLQVLDERCESRS
jgi:hypothetical protein